MPMNNKPKIQPTSKEEDNPIREKRIKKEAQQLELYAKKTERYGKLEVYLGGKYHTDHRMARCPLYTTGKAGENKVAYDWKAGNRFAQIVPSSVHGQPDENDGDLVRYAASKAIKTKKDTGVLPNPVFFTPYEFFKETGRTKGGKNYDWLENAVLRLSGLVVHGNIFRLDEEIVDNGTFVSVSYERDKGSKRVCSICVQFNFGILQSLAKEKGIVQISEQILKERNPLKKRVLEYTSVYLGSDSSKNIGYGKYVRNCSYTGEGGRREFKKILKRYMKKDDFPYYFEWKRGVSDELIVVTLKSAFKNKLLSQLS